jgi:hypothetical protein
MATSRKPDPAPEPDETAPEPEDVRPVVAEYLDETPRTYHWPDGPQTAELGDMCALPDGWENDGRWRVAKLVITRLRDNHPEQAAKTSARQTQARNELHARLAEEAKGGEQR